MTNWVKVRVGMSLAALLSCIATGCKGHSDAQAGLLDGIEGREKRETKYDNGQRKEEFSVIKDKAGNYVKDGPYVSFHQSGQKSEEGSYKADKMVGHWQTWDSAGKLTLDIVYRDGAREGAFKTYADGVLTQSGSYAADRLEGSYQYTAFDGFVVSGAMHADVPDGAWKIAEKSGKVRARAAFKEGKLASPIESLADDGSVRPPLPATGCADFGGYALGTVRWGDAIFQTFARTHRFPIDAGINKFSSGQMLRLNANLLDASGIDEILLIFDRDDLLTALTGKAPKQRGDKAYADVIKQLNADYAKKYTVVSASMPFVGDCNAEYRNQGCIIEFGAPHMESTMNLVLHSAAFDKAFRDAHQASP